MMDAFLEEEKMLKSTFVVIECRLITIRP